MPRYIIHKDGAYNFYTTIADGPIYESALTLDDLREVVKQESGETGLQALPERLERAHKTGCSDTGGMTLEECVSCNRAGQNEEEVPYDEFIAKYLTLPVRL